MSEKTVSKSFRLPQSSVSWIAELAKAKGITQTELVSNLVNSARHNEGESISIARQMTSGGTTPEDSEGLQVLTTLGISTVGGLAGYHVAGWVRKQLEMDEDKGTQIIFGLVAGLGTLLLQVYRKKK